MVRVGIIVFSMAAVAFMQPIALRAQWMPTDTNVQFAKGFANLGPLLFTITAGGVFLSTDDGIIWEKIGSGGESGRSIVALGTKLFAAYHSGGQVQWSSDTGRTWNEQDLGNMRVDYLAVANGVIFANDDSHSLRSPDTGWTWLPISEFTQFNALIANGSILCVNPGPYVSGFFTSSDQGASWRQPPPCDTLSPNFHINCLLSDSGRIIAGGNGIYYSQDNGSCWKVLSVDLDSAEVWSLILSDSSMFAGTDKGVYYSVDQGARWNSIGLNRESITSLFVHDNYLFAAVTDSPGVWRRGLSEIIGSSSVSGSVTSKFVIQCYPNPFSQSTIISLPPASSGYTDVTVVNLLGVEVARIFSGELTAGEQHFTWEPTGLPDGMYTCLVRRNGRVETLPVMLLR